MSEHRVFGMSIAALHRAYVAKAERKGRTRAEVDEILCWLTGLSAEGLADRLAAGPDLRTFFAEAPGMNPARERVTGVVCGVRVETVADPLMREIRILDKLIDELTKGKAMAKILGR